MVGEGLFREDLFYRLKGLILRTPALTERREDIPLLAALFLKRALPKRRMQLTPDASAWLSEQSWPGNVRELQSLMECTAALAQPGAKGEAPIDVAALCFAQGSTSAPVQRQRRGLDEAIAVLEVQMITAALSESGNNRSEAARLLGISRVGLLKKLDRLGLR
jgi:two-component system NtrC family response regulator